MCYYVSTESTSLLVAELESSGDSLRLIVQSVTEQAPEPTHAHLGKHDNALVNCPPQQSVPFPFEDSTRRCPKAIRSKWNCLPGWLSSSNEKSTSLEIV